MTRKKFNHRRKRDQRSRGSSPSRKKAKVWQVTPRENEKFFNYYKNSGIIPADEWEQFAQIIVQDLPTTFRASTIGPFSEFTFKHLKEFAAMPPIEVDGEVFQPPTPLSWYPNDGAWYISTGRGALRKHPAFKKFHEFLTIFTENGAISRQEAVSMIPPLLLDVKPEHTILDMCAAPGSKTAQIVEIMHEQIPVNQVPTGVVVANDIDEKRCYMMIHQINRLSSPIAIVTNHEAQKFPTIELNPEQAAKFGSSTYEFDRILADVPCTGDGTLRKNFDLWSKWSPGMAFGIHKIQIQIAAKGMMLLKVGGRMVYSTCSLNPLEDEAVLSEVLRRAKGSFELVDISDKLPSLKRSAGISQWKVMDKEGTWFEKYDDIPDPKKSAIVPSLFPPTSEEAKEFCLERAIRLLPHHQNTGGFFVAVLRKLSPLPEDFSIYPTKTDSKTESETKSSSPKTNETTSVNDSDSQSNQQEEQKTDPSKSTTAHSQKKQNRETKQKPNVRHSKEDPFLFLIGPRWEQTLANIKQFFQLSDDFPTHLLFSRSEGKCPRIYLMSEAANTLLNIDTNKELRLINMGLKIFGKHSFKDAVCDYRINSESLLPLSPYLGVARRIDITLDDLLLLLTTEHPHLYKFSKAANEHFEDLKDIGGIWFSLDLKDTMNISKPLMLSGWRGKVSAHLLGSAQEIKLIKYVFNVQSNNSEPSTTSTIEKQPETKSESIEQKEPDQVVPESMKE